MVWEGATQILDNSDNVIVYEPFQRENYGTQTNFKKLLKRLERWLSN